MNALKYPIIGSDIIIAGMFLFGWIWPRSLSVETIWGLQTLFILEFFTIHSAGVMSPMILGPGRPITRILGIILLSSVFTVFVGVFSYARGSIWPLLAFWGLTGRRIVSVLIGRYRTETSRTAVLEDWTVSAGCYVVCVVLTLFIPLPRLGVSPQFVERITEPGSGGIWVEQPYRLFCAGFLYFTALGIWDTFRPEWLLAPFRRVKKSPS
jgi:hypothetical protein